jgi:ABC-type nitrate/sulfonate/bicarbonate transport system permease component
MRSTVTYRRRAHDGRAQPVILARVVVPRRCPRESRCARRRERLTAVVAAGWSARRAACYAVEWYRELLMTPKVMAFIAMIGLLGYLCDASVRRLHTALVPWAPSASIGAGVR